MTAYGDDEGMSELERELEQEEEMEDPEEGEFEEDLEELGEAEYEYDEGEPELEFEESEQEFEDFEGEVANFANRFYELSMRSFESEAEVDDSINRILGEMEREFFFKRLWRGIKRGGKWLLKKGKRLMRRLPFGGAVRWITRLARGNLRGLLSSLAKGALGAAIPGGGAMLPALRRLGFETGEDPEANREAWRNFVHVSREAYDHLARNLNENSDEPHEAARQATEAFTSSLRRRRIPGRTRRAGYARRRGRRLRLRLKSGDVLIVRRA